MNDLMSAKYIDYYSYLDKYIRNRLTYMFKGDIIELQWRILGNDGEKYKVSYNVNYVTMGKACGMLVVPTYEDYISEQRDKKIDDLLNGNERD